MKEYKIPEEIKLSFGVSMAMSRQLHHLLEGLMHEHFRSADEFAAIMRPVAEVGVRAVEDVVTGKTPNPERMTLDWDKLTPQQKMYASVYAAVGLIADGLATAAGSVVADANNPERN